MMRSWQKKILPLVICLMAVAWYQTVSGQSPAAHDSLARKTPTIVDVVADDHMGAVFLLDDKGNVWALRKTMDMYEFAINAFKLPKLKNITRIAPYIALDRDGHVFVWALDGKTKLPVPNTPSEDIDPGTVNIVCTDPTGVTGVVDVGLVAYERHHFVVATKSGDILEWYEIPVPQPYSDPRNEPGPEIIGVAGYGPVRKVHSSDQVTSLGCTGSSLIALFRDGKILGWGLTENGQTSQKAAGKQVFFAVPSAVAVYLNRFRAIILAKDRHVVYYGGCGFQFEGDRPLTNVFGPLSGVKNVAMGPGDGPGPDFLMKKDGSVWEAFMPIPPGFEQTWCAEFANRAVLARPNGVLRVDSTIKAIKVATYENFFLVLGEDHQLWKSHYREGLTPKLEEMQVIFEAD